MLLDNLTPGQRKAVYVGAPVVAVLGIVSALRKKDAPVDSTSPAVTGVIAGTTAPTTDAIGTGQLAEFESLVSGSISQLANQVYNVQTSVESIPAPTTTVVNQATAPVAPALKDVNSAWFPSIAPQGSEMTVLGSVNGGQYSGLNVGHGAPVYALVDGQWRQNFDSSKLADNTPLATLATFASYAG